MSSAEVQGVFDVEEEHGFNFEIGNNTSTEEKGTDSPSGFLNNLPPHPAASTISESDQPAPEFMPAISPSLMLSSMANSSPATESILSSAKERINQIRPWKDFFSLDQFRVPESSTAAQSRASHNFAHFQNNYLLIFLLFCAFSL